MKNRSEKLKCRCCQNWGMIEAMLNEYGFLLAYFITMYPDNVKVIWDERILDSFKARLELLNSFMKG